MKEPKYQLGQKLVRPVPFGETMEILEVMKSTGRGARYRVLSTYPSLLEKGKSIERVYLERRIDQLMHKI